MNKQEPTKTTDRREDFAMTDMTISEKPYIEDTAIPSVPPFDPARYAKHLEDLDLSDEQAAQFLETLWSIMVGFVDLGWNVDSVQHILAERAELSSEFAAHAVKNSDTQPALTFNEAAADGGDKDDSRHDE